MTLRIAPPGFYVDGEPATTANPVRLRFENKDTPPRRLRFEARIIEPYRGGETRYHIVKCLTVAARETELGGDFGEDGPVPKRHMLVGDVGAIGLNFPVIFAGSPAVTARSSQEWIDMAIVFIEWDPKVFTIRSAYGKRSGVPRRRS